MTCHLCTKAMCLKYCVRVRWWQLRKVSTACGFSTTDGYFLPVTISFILKEKFNVVYFEKAQTIRFSTRKDLGFLVLVNMGHDQ